MAFLDELAAGRFGVVVKPPSYLAVTDQTPTSATFADETNALGWWFMIHPGIHLALEPAAALDRDIQRQTRFLFESVYVAGDPMAKQPRTADLAWTPVIDVERVGVPGGTALGVLHRMQYQPTREVIMGHTLIPTARGLFEARWFARAQMTGTRESTLMLMFNPTTTNITIPPQATFDDPKHDAMFPDHPLSRARRVMRWYADGALRVTSTPPATPRDVVIDSLRCRVRLPERFALMGHGDGSCAFARASFSGNDCVERLLVTRTKAQIRDAEQAERLPTLAAGAARRICVDAGLANVTCESRGDVIVTEGDRPPPGYGRARTASRWFLDAQGWVWSIEIVSTVAVPVAELVADVTAVARSWVPNT